MKLKTKPFNERFLTSQFRLYTSYHHHFCLLTNDIKVNEGLSLAVFVLDNDLVSALVRLLRILEAVLGVVRGGVNVVFGQTQVAVKPVGLSLGIGTERHCHDDGFTSVSHVALVCGLYLGHGWKNTCDLSVQISVRL